MIKSAFHRIFNDKVDAIGLAVFRIAYTLVLLGQLLRLFRFRHLIYDAAPFRYVGDIDVTYIFCFWFAVLGFMLLGWYTRVATLLNYIFGCILFDSAIQFEYHVFYGYVGLNFLLLFMPLSRVLSVDSLICKLKYSRVGKAFVVDRNVLLINYLAPVFVGVGLVYFDSVFRKIDSQMWMDGLGMWLPSSLPMAVWNDTSWILNQEFLVKFLGYLVIVFEGVFIFLFWFKKFRVPFMLLGIFFHLGILVTYPIPWFALTAIALYLLLMPPSVWLWIAARLRSKSRSYKFYYDAECPICQKVVIAVKHLDLFDKIDCLSVQACASHDVALQGISAQHLLLSIHGVNQKGKVFSGYDAYVELLRHMGYTYPWALLMSLPGISGFGRKTYRYIAGHRLTERCTEANCLLPVYEAPPTETDDFLVRGWNPLRLSKLFWKYLVMVTLALQFVFILNSPIIRRHTAGSLVGDVFAGALKWTRLPARKILGITAHPVFMYRMHFAGYEHIFKVVCNTNHKMVPLLDDRGMVTNSYANGALWVNFTFRTASGRLQQRGLENGLTRYLRFFEASNGLSTSNYTIYMKKIETTNKWQKDFLKRQIEKPWEWAGTATLTLDDTNYQWGPEMQDVFLKEIAIPQNN